MRRVLLLLLLSFITNIVWGFEKVDFELLCKSSGRYSDADPERFRIDDIGLRTVLYDNNIRFHILTSTTPDISMKEAWLWASLFRTKWLDRAYIKLGLLRIPFGYNQRFIEHDLTLEYPLVTRELFDDGLGFFDVGGSFGIKLSTSAGGVMWEGAVLRGERLGGEETDKSKTLCTRLLIVPIYGVEFGISWYDGSRVEYYDAAHPAIETNRDRLGFHAIFRYRFLRVMYEFIRANDGNAVERDRNSFGWSFEVGVFLKRDFRYWDPEHNLFCGTQFVFRIDLYRPPPDHQMRILTGRSIREKITYTFGFSLNFTPMVRLLIYWSHRDWGPYYEGRLGGGGENDDRAGLVLFLRF